MNKFKKIITIAIGSLHRNKGRTGLSILGIVIGIATVLTIFSTGESIKKIITEEANSFGTDYIQTEVKVPSASHTSQENVTGQAQGIVITTLKVEDGEAIKKLDNISDFYAGILDQRNLNYQEFNKNVFIYAVSPSFIDIDPGEVSQGRFFSVEENETLAQVIVLGSGVAESMFGNEDPIGKYVRVNQMRYQVIGVMEKRGSSLFFDQDNLVYAPIKTVQKKLLGVDYVTFIFSKVVDSSLSDYTALEIEELLRDRHNISDPSRDDFAVVTSAQALDILGNVTGATSILLLLIASISLIVGSVGIMNIMYVAVNERVNEIGLRKAVGASEKDIRTQFLTESVAITTIGGLVGVFFGILITYGISALATNLGYDWPAVFKPTFFLISIGVAMIVGLMAGYLPANKAAKLDPIEAMRR